MSVTGCCLASEEHQLSLTRRPNLSSRWTRPCCWQTAILQIQILLLKLPQICQFLLSKGCLPPLPRIHLLILHQILQRMTAPVRRAAAAAATNPCDSTNKRTCSDSARLPPRPPSAPRPSSCQSSVQGPSSNVSKEVTARTRDRTQASLLSPPCKGTMSSAHLSRTVFRKWKN